MFALLDTKESVRDGTFAVWSPCKADKNGVATVWRWRGGGCRTYVAYVQQCVLKEFVMIPARIAIVAVLAVLLAVPATGQTPRKAARPAQLQALIACREIGEAGARLACFDRQVAAVDEAEARNDLVIVDRQQIRSTRRALFGLTLPRIAFLESGGQDTLPEEVDGKIRKVSTTSDGKWMFQLEDAVWRATEVFPFQADPKAGDNVKIRRGPLGSYKLSVEGRSALRAIRVR